LSALGPCRSTIAAAAGAAVLIAAALAGCGGSTSVDKIHGQRLTIFESVPLKGASEPDGQAVLNGAQLALDQVGGRVGLYRIQVRVLDDAVATTGLWNPGQTEADARLAAEDKTAIGYIGDLDSGASAVSIPLLNREDIAQISPTSTAVGLTSDAPGSSPGEPEKYYPTGARTFARVIPNDLVGAAAEVTLQQQLGCTRTIVIDDDEVDGVEFATTFTAAAANAGLNVLSTQSYEPGAANYTSFAQSIASSTPDCVLLSALNASSAVLVTEALAAALPSARIFSSGSLAESAYTDPSLGGIPLSLDSRVMLTVAALGARAYPPAGRAFLHRYELKFGSPPPDAIFGYEAMSLMLDAISRATGDGRRAALRSTVVAALFDTRNRQSVLGTYSIDSAGDTSLREYGVWRVVDGRLSFWKAISG
jgi:branched-chain amino acid transport system substrate-binding protein